MPSLQELTYTFFSGRPSLAEHLLNDRKVVTLLGPEPAYTAAHILSIYLFLMYSKQNTFVMSSLFLLLMLMTRANTVIMILPLVVMFGVLTKRFSPRRLVIVFAAIAGGIYIFAGHLKFLFYRLIDFFELLYETGSVLEAENELGSVRIDQIVNTVFTFFSEDYVKPFSFIGNLNITTFSLSLAFVSIVIFYGLSQKPATTIIGLCIVILSGQFYCL